MYGTKVVVVVVRSKNWAYNLVDIGKKGNTPLVVGICTAVIRKGNMRTKCLGNVKHRTEVTVE
jgi:hypothetical protein